MPSHRCLVTASAFAHRRRSRPCSFSLADGDWFYASDLVQLPDLLCTTAKNFNVREVLGDIAYNTVANQKEVAAIGAEAFFPFKSSHSGRAGGIWREKFLQWRDDDEYFCKHYH